jgi:hypothetical protein
MSTRRERDEERHLHREMGRRRRVDIVDVLARRAKKTRRMVSSACFCSVSAHIGASVRRRSQAIGTRTRGTFVPIVKIRISNAVTTHFSQWQVNWRIHSNPCLAPRCGAFSSSVLTTSPVRLFGGQSLFFRGPESKPGGKGGRNRRHAARIGRRITHSQPPLPWPPPVLTKVTSQLTHPSGGLRNMRATRAGRLFEG